MFCLAFALAFVVVVAVSHAHIFSSFFAFFSCCFLFVFPFNSAASAAAFWGGVACLHCVSFSAPATMLLSIAFKTCTNYEKWEEKVFKMKKNLKILTGKETSRKQNTEISLTSLWPTNKTKLGYVHNCSWQNLQYLNTNTANSMEYYIFQSFPPLLLLWSFIYFNALYTASLSQSVAGTRNSIKKAQSNQSCYCNTLTHTHTHTLTEKAKPVCISFLSF